MNERYRYEYNAEYADGNTVRRRKKQQDERFREVKGGKARRRKHMSFGYMIFLCVAMAFVAIVATGYVSLRMQITNSANTISALESQLNELRQENDEKYNKASSNVDPDEIKRIAMEEYGMTYADENQIVTYSDEGGDDYVRQNEAIPQK
jgi:cell division protein FtsL